MRTLRKKKTTTRKAKTVTMEESDYNAINKAAKLEKRSFSSMIVILALRALGK